MTEQEAQLPTEDEIREWLEQADPKKDLPRFYEFLTKIVLLSLIHTDKYKLGDIFKKNTLKYSYIVYRTPIILSYKKHKFNDMQNLSGILHEIATEFEDQILYPPSPPEQPEDKIGYMLLSTSRATVQAYTDTIEHTLSSSGPTSYAIREISTLDSLPNFIAKPNNFINEEIIIELCNAWQELNSAEIENTNIEDKLIKNIHKLLEINLDFLADDLVKLINQEEIAPERLQAYTKKLDDSVFVSPETLKAALFGEQAKQHTIRCLLVGPGGAGKTNLFQLLTNHKIASYNSATEKISQQLITSCEDWLENKNSDAKINIQLWDFAGQTQYYGLHQSFFTNRCIYVLVVDSRHEQSPYEWLYQISHIANQNTKVLIVINEYEGCPAQLNQADMIERFDGLLTKESFITINLSPESDITNAIEFKSLKNKIARNALIEQTVMSKAVANLYDELLQEDTEQIDQAEMLKTAKDKRINWDRDEVEAVLEHLGVFIKNEQEGMWLSTKWLNNTSYNFLNKLNSRQKVHKKGELRKLLNGEGLDYLLGFVKETNLCIEVENQRL